MKMRYRICLFLLTAFALFNLTHEVHAQRSRPAKVTSLQATVDKTGQDPATAEIAGPAPITCLNAVSETPNSRPAPSCHVTARGFNGTLNKGETANATGAGSVTLNCYVQDIAPLQLSSHLIVGFSLR